MDEFILIQDFDFIVNASSLGLKDENKYHTRKIIERTNNSLRYSLQTSKNRFDK